MKKKIEIYDQNHHVQCSKITIGEDLVVENKGAQFNKIDFAKKVKDANSDIDKINEILADTSLFHHKADDLYAELSKNTDYAPYIYLLRKRQRV